MGLDPLFAALARCGQTEVMLSGCFERATVDSLPNRIFTSSHLPAGTVCQIAGLQLAGPDPTLPT